ncbi:MAG: AraC family transcriptional regulator [Clostridia bacterium]|nr:AraC family transcriptional regulator [Clostridia bacterium]
MSDVKKNCIDHSLEKRIWSNMRQSRQTDVLMVEMAGITYPDKNYAIRRTRNTKRVYDNLYVIEYVVSGVGYIESEGLRASVGAGDLYIIHRRTVHSYYADKQQPFCKKWLNVSGRFMNAMEEAFLDEAPFTVVRLGESAEKIIDSIHGLLEGAKEDSESLRGEVMRQLLELFLMIDSHKRALRTEMSPYEQICEYIEQNICNDLNVSVIASKFFISPSTLYRLFMSNAGVSPKEYIVGRKISLAKRMIGANDSTFNDIAASLGFYDSHHFFKTFRSVTGQSPTEYRKSLLEEEKQE